MFSTSIGKGTCAYPLWKAATAPHSPGAAASDAKAAGKTDATAGTGRPVPVIGGYGQRLTPATAAQMIAMTGEGTDATSAAPAWNSNDERLMNVRGVTDAERARYRDILNSFVNSPDNMFDPQGFLSSLSSDDLHLLAHVRSWGANSKLDPSTMNDEEAINFILPDSRQVDLNDDGLIASGNGGRSWRFPPPNAPQAAKDAWEEATQGMSVKDRMILEISFMPLNIKVDENGRATAIEPGSAEWENPFSDPDFSYRDMVAKTIAGLEFSRPANDSATIDRLIAHLHRFDAILTGHGVA